MKNKKHRIIKRRTNIMPEHLRKQEFVVKELSNSPTRRVIRVVQSNLVGDEWRVEYYEMNQIVSVAISFKQAHELYELGYPCYAYEDSIFKPVNEVYFTRIV